MSTNNRRILITCLVLAAVVCVCAAGIAISGTGVFLINQRASGPNNGMPTPIAQAITAGPSVTQPEGLTPGVTLTAPARNLPTPTPGNITPLPGATLSPAISQQMDQIQTQVESYRGLHAINPVQRGLLTSTQLRQKVLNDFLKDYTAADAAKDATVLSDFGLLPANFDYLTFQENFLSEQIAGFYDDTTKEMFVITDTGFGGIERFNYAHEYTHVLQDQTYDLQGKLGYSTAKCKNNSEHCAAIQALIEGDAVLSQEQWLTDFSTALDRQQIAQSAGNLNTPVYDSAPEFYKEDALFPYTQGLEFVQTLFDKGGWQAVDNAYANTPVSTEQILHPNLYPNAKPVSVALPDLSSTLGDNWKQLDADTLGEWYTYLVLAAGSDPQDRLPTAQAKTAAAGWGGDAYAVYSDGQANHQVLVVRWQWDTKNDANEFTDAFKTYGTDRWGGSLNIADGTTQWRSSTSYVTFIQSGQTTTWILAPDAKTASEVAGAIK